MVGTVLLSFTAFAAAPPKPDQPNISPAFCRALTRHVPAPDVAYKSGVDVHGKPVTPADLEPAPDLLPKEINIPLTADMMGFLGIDKTTLPFSAMQRTDMQLGTLTVKGSLAYLNGTLLSNEQQERLQAGCLNKTSRK
jgi:hypothetical protein